MSPLAWRLFELSQLRGIGPKTLRGLVGHPGLETATAEDLRFMDRRLARALKEPGVFERAQSIARQQLENADSQDTWILCSVDPDFPALLKNTDDGRSSCTFGVASTALLRSPSASLVLGNPRTTEF